MNTRYLEIDPGCVIAPGFLNYARFAMSPLSDVHWFAIECRSGADAEVDINLRAMLIENLLLLAQRPMR